MRILIGAPAFLLVAMLGAEGLSGAAPAPPPTVGTGPGRHAKAASNAGALDRLFESLREAESPEIARGIEQVIWSIWLNAGNHDVDRLLGLSVEAMNKREFPLARSYLDRVVALEPDFAEGWNKRATVHFLEVDYARSIEDIRRVLSLEPRHFGALSGLGMILETIGQKGEALATFRRVLAIHPQIPAVQRRVEVLSVEVEGQEL